MHHNSTAIRSVETLLKATVGSNGHMQTSYFVYLHTQILLNTKWPSASKCVKSLQYYLIAKGHPHITYANANAQMLFLALHQMP